MLRLCVSIHSYLREASGYNRVMLHANLLTLFVVKALFCGQRKAITSISILYASQCMIAITSAFIVPISIGDHYACVLGTTRPLQKIYMGLA